MKIHGKVYGGEKDLHDFIDLEKALDGNQIWHTLIMKRIFNGYT